jgi:hypothetical protein
MDNRHHLRETVFANVIHCHHLRRKILPLCQHMTFFARMYELFYCTNLNKKGSATVVWIIFPKVYFYKKLRFMNFFVSFCVTGEVATRICDSNYLSATPGRVYRLPRTLGRYIGNRQLESVRFDLGNPARDDSRTQRGAR